MKMNGKLKLLGEALNEQDNDLTEKLEHLQEESWYILGMNFPKSQKDILFNFTDLSLITLKNVITFFPSPGNQ
jgi:hypothetical protein